MQLTINSTHQSNSALSVEKSFDKFPLTIGRNSSCDMVLPDDQQFVSSRHLQIDEKNEQLFVTDTSSNGTFINDASTPVGRGNQVLLNGGDVLTAGEFQLQITFKQGESSNSSDDPFGSNTPAASVDDHDDPFAALGAANPSELKDPPPPQAGRHIDRLDEIGIGPDSWDTSDDPFGSIDDDNSRPSDARSASVIESQRQINSGSGNSADTGDDWDGWLDDLPAPASSKPAQNQAHQAASGPHHVPATGIQDDGINLLLQAAGLNPADFANIDKNQLAQHIGKILNRSTHSMMLLLRSRAEIKNAMHAEVTLLASKGNNPLKFSVNVEDALNRLLTPSPTDGYTAADKAIEKALDDIKIHQIAMLEGMRASLKIALSHFDPEMIEKKITKQAPLAAALPLAREAKLWEQFKTSYSKIKSEALDDFGNQFGQEIKTAYEQSIKDLKN